MRSQRSGLGGCIAVAMALDSTLGLYGPADGPTGTLVRVDG